MPVPESALLDLALIKDATREAGALAMRYFGAPLKKWQKPGDGTPVTEADLAVNELLHGRLTGARPGYGWLSEESADNTGRQDSQRLFVIDPIDGTIAFMKGKPHFAISVALVEAGRPVIGALFNPATDEFFEAVSGRGALLNGNPIHTSATTHIADSMMAASESMFRHPAWPRPWPEMRFIQRNSVAYRIALVAAGMADAALALSSKNDWDLAAADLILHEAGGLLTTHTGAPLVYNQPVPRHPSLVAANPALHRLLLDRVEAIRLP
ncbi:MAG: 3'(2'),5'-bisphosphate nucleotidase CysQ [Parvibaculaceae bacterium]|nr:3'(2'),5'-bisphosphate nucleotidase CysQ [Parvibaculaceae bacterium]